MLSDPVKRAEGAEAWVSLRPAGIVPQATLLPAPYAPFLPVDAWSVSCDCPTKGSRAFQ